MHRARTISVNTFLAVLIGTGAAFQASRAQAAGSRGPIYADEPSRGFSWTEEAGGENRPHSKERALEKAQQTLKEFLRRQDPPVQSVPSLNYIRRHLIKDAKLAFERKEGGLSFRTWRWTFEVSPTDWKYFLWQDRQARVDQRMGLLGRIVTALVALFGVLAGYIRLDEWTKGYYTGRLRLGALAVLLLVGGGLWFLA
jgi:hypothetical protein